MSVNRVKTFWAICLLGMATALLAEHFSYDAGDIEGTRTAEGGITYTLSVTKGNLNTTYDFDTRPGVTSGAPTGINISVSSGGATGTVGYGADSLPTADFTISMNGKLIPPGEGEGPQPTWSASGTAKAPFFILPKNKYIWLDGSTTFTASENANWFINNQKVHTGTSFSVGESANWEPPSAGIFVITARAVSNSSDTDTTTLTVVDVLSGPVNAGTPQTTQISYQLFPAGVSCNGKFSINGTLQSQKGVAGSFAFSFNQSALPFYPAASTLTLTLSGNDLPEKTLSATVNSQSVRKLSTNTLRVYIVAEGIGYRSCKWNSAIEACRIFNYSVPASGKLVQFYSALSGATVSSYGDLTNFQGSSGTMILAFGMTFSDESQERPIDVPLDSLSPNWVVRGKNIEAEKFLNVSSLFKIYPSFSTTDGIALIPISAGGTITLSVN